MMGALREMSEMFRDYGLGNRYFLLTGALVAALMVVLFLWGRDGDEPPPAEVVPLPVTAPAQPGY
jgi:hypothetical protein